MCVDARGSELKNVSGSQLEKELDGRLKMIAVLLVSCDVQQSQLRVPVDSKRAQYDSLGL